MSVKQGTLIVHEQAGGGGFGDPAQRPRELVIEDARDGKITPAYATEFHGVDVGGQ
jgi:N-methylhydantoinase B